MAPPRWWYAQQNQQRAYNAPIIDKDVIDEWLARKRDDHRWLKELPYKATKALVDSEWNAFRFPNYNHQNVGFILGTTYKKFLFPYDPGLGKTKMVYDILHYHRVRSGLKRTLVLVPHIVNIDTWEQQAKLHAPEAIVQPLYGTRELRHELINEQANVFVLNYAGLQSYMTELGPSTKGKKMQRVVNYNAANDFANMFDSVVFDEIHEVGGVTSLSFRLCKRIANVCRFRYGLSGTLFDKDPTPLWGQYYLIDGGYTLGETLGVFRAAMFNAVQNRWKAIDYHFDSANTQRLRDMVQHRALRYEDAECLDLPKLMPPIMEEVPWGESQLAFYKKAKGVSRTAAINKTVSEITYHQWRYITAGYYKYKQHDEARVVPFNDNPKLDRLVQLLKALPAGNRKALIYYWYVPTGKLIRQRLKKEGIGYASVWSGTKDPVAQLRRFQNDTGCIAMVGNSRALGTGVDGLQQHTSCVIFYESPGPRLRKQCIKRLHRPGQTRRVYVYDLVTINSIDAKIVDAAVNGLDLYEEIFKRK